MSSAENDTHTGRLMSMREHLDAIDQDVNALIAYPEYSERVEILERIKRNERAAILLLERAQSALRGVDGSLS